MTDKSPALDVLLDYKLRSAYWCDRRHRWVVRVRFERTHPDAPKTVLCRTAPEAAARYNAAVRALREYPTGDPRINDLVQLFRSTRATEGPGLSGSRILMIQPPFCWVKVSDGMEWLEQEEWFVEPESERPALCHLVKDESGWRWQYDFLDEVIWRNHGREGVPYHLNGDPMDCRLENLAGSQEQKGGLIKPLGLGPISGAEASARRMLNECWLSLKLDQPSLDPWVQSVELIDGERVRKHEFEAADRRWLLDVAKRHVPELLEVPLWRERSELIRLLSRPWTVQWGKRKRRSKTNPAESERSELDDG